MTAYETDAEAAAKYLYGNVLEAARDVAAPYAMPESAVTADLLKRLKALSRATPSDADGRCAAWRVRAQIVGPTGDIRADSDPDAPLDRPGSEVIVGLPAVAKWVAEIAWAYHAPREPVGLDKLTLDHSLKSFRPTLSRWNGVSTWRPRYYVGEETWHVVVDVRREGA